MAVWAERIVNGQVRPVTAMGFEIGPVAEKAQNRKYLRERYFLEVAGVEIFELIPLNHDKPEWMREPDDQRSIWIHAILWRDQYYPSFDLVHWEGTKVKGGHRTVALARR